MIEEDKKYYYTQLGMQDALTNIIGEEIDKEKSIDIPRIAKEVKKYMVFKLKKEREKERRKVIKELIRASIKSREKEIAKRTHWSKPFLSTIGLMIFLISHSLLTHIEEWWGWLFMIPMLWMLMRYWRYDV